MSRYIPFLVDASLMRDDRRTAVVEWIQSLGLETSRLMPRFAIVRGADEWELHVTRRLRGPSGGDMLDLAQQAPVCAPVVVHLGTLEQVWPDLGVEGLIK